MGLHEEIARAAYYLYERSGWLHGNDEEHWLEAERQLRGSLRQKASGAVKKTALTSPPVKKTIIKRRTKPGSKPGVKMRP
jgi:hypothetical protein